MMKPNPGSDETLIHECQQGKNLPSVYLHDCHAYMMIDGEQTSMKFCPYCGVNIEEDAYGHSAGSGVRKNDVNISPITVISREIEQDELLAKAVDILREQGIKAEKREYLHSRACIFWSVGDVISTNSDGNALTSSELETILVSNERRLLNTMQHVGYCDVFDAIEEHVSERQKLSLNELQERWPQWEEAVIVFSVNSDTSLPENSRSYLVNTKDNFWDATKCGTGLFGQCLDGSDIILQLNKPLQMWTIDYCYIVE